MSPINWISGFSGRYFRLDPLTSVDQDQREMARSPRSITPTPSLLNDAMPTSDAIPTSESASTPGKNVTVECPRNDNGSRGSRIHEMRNRVRVMCKPGSVGDLGGQPPRSTRPNNLVILPATTPWPNPAVSGSWRLLEPFRALPELHETSGALPHWRYGPRLPGGVVCSGTRQVAKVHRLL